MPSGVLRPLRWMRTWLKSGSAMPNPTGSSPDRATTISSGSAIGQHARGQRADFLDRRRDHVRPLGRDGQVEHVLDRRDLARRTSLTFDRVDAELVPALGELDDLRGVAREQRSSSRKYAKTSKSFA